MSPTNPDVMELVYASKLLAKTIDEVDDKAATIIAKVDALQSAESSLRELVAQVDKKLEILPLVIAGKLEGLVEKRTSEAFEDIRVSLDELRNKLWAIKKQIKEHTGSQSLPSREQIAQWERDSKKEEGDGIEIRKGRFKMNLPISEGTWHVLKVIGYVLAGLAATLAAGGGIWSFVEHVKHSLPGGG